MKLTERRFSVPTCIFEDGLPDKAFILLVFLFSQSDMSGMVSPGYTAMKTGAHITSRSTIAKSLDILKKHGWFHFSKRNGHRNATYWLRIPPRWKSYEREKNSLKIAQFRAV